VDGVARVCQQPVGLLTRSGLLPKRLPGGVQLLKARATVTMNQCHGHVAIAHKMTPLMVATRTAEQRQRTAAAALPPPVPFPSDHQPQRRRGRPPKVAREVAPDDSDIVEWWSPGWQEKYR
jgi:hypothetical protein